MKSWISIFAVLLCLNGCTPTENVNDENRTVFTIDPTKGSPFAVGTEFI